MAAVPGQVTGILGWLRRAKRWILLALAVLVPWAWAVYERRRANRAESRADWAEGAIVRDQALASERAEIDRRANGALVEISAETERAAAPHEVAARASADLSLELASTPEPSLEQLEQASARASASLGRVRAAAARLRSDGAE